jgi:integrin beta 3
MRDVQKVADGLFDSVKAYLGKALSPLLDRVDALEKRAPERGERGEKGLPGERGEIGKDGRDGIDGKDGLSGKDGRDGVDGKDGERGGEGPEGKPGRDGRDGLPGVQGEKGLDGINGKDGRDGINGKDGLGVGDFDVAHDGERMFTLRWMNGEKKEERVFVVPCQIYRGVFKEGETYARGDTVTFGGSLWHCNGETADKPGDGAKSWTLAAKRGRDGADGKLVPQKAREPLKLS